MKRDRELNEALGALLAVAVEVALQLGRQYAREHPGDLDVVVDALKRGAQMEARVRLAPTPNVDLIITATSGDEIVIASGLFRPKAQSAVLN